MPVSHYSARLEGSRTLSGRSNQLDSNIITTIASAVGVLVGMYAIVNRTEDRLGKRIEESKETLRAEMKAGSATLELNLRKELTNELIKHIDNAFERFELLLKLHEAEHHKQ